MRWLALAATLACGCGRADDPTSCTPGLFHDGQGEMVTLAPRGATCRVYRASPDGVWRDGVGFVRDGELVVGWSAGKEYGAISYAIAPGRLIGSEAENGYDSLADEVLEGPSGLSGTYSIVAAHNHTGVTYSGTVTIAPRGDDLYDLVWDTDCACASGPHHERYVGVGVVRGGRLVAAWGSEGSDVELFAYAITPSGLDGQRVARGVTEHESLARR
ncbi:MAG TPA: hypothetical protein VLX92_04345 [Kofleriaceae bacterium]|nr:hypothetical protein [Kofleriaceae bacterium]